MRRCENNCQWVYWAEGRPPGGVSHWVAYGIAPTVAGFAEGEASKRTDKYVGGKSLTNLPHYFGPCTPPGPPHHYMFPLMATDLEPNALQPGMTRDELIKALDGKVKQSLLIELIRLPGSWQSV